MVWIILLSPLVGAILNGLFLRKVHKNTSHFIGSALVGLSFVGAIVVFKEMLQSHNGQLIYTAYNWLNVGSLNVEFEVIIDRLSGLMLLIVTGIGTLIHVYAGGYMHEEKTTWRFFSYLNLFIFMMLILVCANNFLVMFIGWEGVGLCSYLLIGYWYENSENAKAGMKAFIVNRIGDIGFLIGIFLVYQHFKTLSFSELSTLISSTKEFDNNIMFAIGLITLCLFIGACGKSAQIPLYIWLPDAMAGPTPVSALIHAATMVTAGIYMMAKLNFLYFLSPTTMTIVAIIGCLTAFVAATIALVQNDIKKVLAYSTVSQLGYMVMACGVGGFSASVFHLLTHACFKALLFLGAGSVIVAMHHKQDMMEMGGLKKYMPITHGVFFIAVLAIIGIPGFSGFFSKDEILWKAFTYPVYGPYLWFVGTLAAGCTAFYMVRLLCLTFYGKNRSDPHTKEHLKETSASMWLPLMVLAFLSVGVGYLGVPNLIASHFGGHNLFEQYLSPVISIHQTTSSHWNFLEAHYSHQLEWSLMSVSVLLVLIAALSAAKLYKDGVSTDAEKLGLRFSKTHRTLSHKYWIDELYHAYIVRPLYRLSKFLWQTIDVKVINGSINGFSHLIMITSSIGSFKISGHLQSYAAFVIIGILSFLILFIT